MSESRYPAGWDAERVKRLINHYEGLTEDDEAATSQQEGQVVVTVPEGLLPAIRQLLASYKNA